MKFFFLHSMQVSNCCNKISPWSPDLLGSNKKSSVHYKLCAYNSLGNLFISFNLFFAHNSIRLLSFASIKILNNIILTWFVAILICQIQYISWEDSNACAKVSTTRTKKEMFIFGLNPHQKSFFQIETFPEGFSIWAELEANFTSHTGRDQMAAFNMHFYAQANN